MSYSIQVGQFAKRINSTKRPTATDLAAFVEYQNVFLKSAPTEYNNPVVRLEAEFASFAPNNYNYAIMFGRWYWITNVVAIRTNLIELHLSLDVLAKARDAILDTKAFIEYGFNTFDAGDSSSRIADIRRPVTKNPTTATAQTSIAGGAFTNQGSYIFTAVANDYGVSCYAVAPGTLRHIFDSVSTSMDNDIDTAGTNLDVADAAKSLEAIGKLISFNYKQSLIAESGVQAIKSIHWLPLHYTEISGTGASIYLGDYDTGETGKLLSNNQLWTHSGSISIPWQASDWKRNNSQISLYIPFFGTIPVPVDQCINNGSVSFTVSLDLLGGDLSIRVTSGNQTIYTGSTNIAAPYAFGFSTVSASKMLSGAIQSVGGALQTATGIVDAGAGIIGAYLGTGGGGLSGAAGNITSGLQNINSGYAQTVQPLITSSGSMGGIAALGQSQDIILTMIYYPPITDSDFESIYGHPVFKVDKPAAGFCKTRGFSLSLGLEPQYISLINSAMDGGVFVE